MSKNLHDIDKLFRDSLEGHEEMPSDKVWDALDNNLDKSNVISIKRKYNNLKRIAIVLLLLLLGTIVYEIQSKKTGKGGIEVVKNNGTDKNENKKNITGNTTQNSGTGKSDQGANDQVKSDNSTASGNREVNNAGKDSGVSTDKDMVNSTLLTPADQKANKKTEIGVQQKANLKLKIRNPKIENGEEIANESIVLPEGNKSSIKKSTIHKTRITIKNATAAEDINDEESTVLKNNNTTKVKSAVAVSNELRALQNEEMESIPANLKKSEMVKVSVKRISPDANVATVAVKIKNNKSAKPFHFNLMPFYSPQFSFNRLEDDHRDPGPQPRNGREQIKEDEQRERSSSLGVLVEIPLGKKWGLQSGITLLNKEISIEPKKIFAKLDIDGKVKYRFDCSSGYTFISLKAGTTPAVGDSVNAVASTNTLQYVGIPLAVNYTISLGKFSVIPTLGTTINFLTRQKIETELVGASTNEKQTISTIQGLKKTYFNAFAGVALEYNVSKKIALNITPVSNFALSAINKDAAVKSYPNSFGVAGGVKIKF
jgi:hypothetical protein